MFQDLKLRRLMLAYWGFAIAAVMAIFWLGVAHAQPSEAPASGNISGGADTMLTFYASIAGLLAMGLAWIGKHLSDWLKTRTKNEAVGGALSRFSDSLFSAVKAVNQTLKIEIDKAKRADSPGGSAITKEEAARLKTAVFDALKAEYGGMAGIAKFLGVLGLGDSSAVESWVGNRIEAAVHDTKGNAAPLS